MDSSTNRVRYLEAKRKQLQELLASDVDTSIPSFTSHTPAAAAAATPKTASRTSSTSLYSNLPRVPPTPPALQPSRIPVMASSSSAETASSSHVRKSPALASARHAATSTSNQSEAKSIPTTVVPMPLTYAQKLQINARYSSFGKANEEAMEKAKLSVEKEGYDEGGDLFITVTQSSSLSQDRASSIVTKELNEQEDERRRRRGGGSGSPLDTTTTSITSKHSLASNSAAASTADLAAAATIVSGTSSSMLKRSTSPLNVTVPTGGGAGQDVSRTTARVLDNLDALDLSLGSIGTAITQEDDDDDDNIEGGERGQRVQATTAAAASSSSSSSSAAQSFSSPPRARARDNMRGEAASASSSLSGSFVISPSPKHKSRNTPSRLLLSPSRLQESSLSAVDHDHAPVLASTGNALAHEQLQYTETSAAAAAVVAAVASSSDDDNRVSSNIPSTATLTAALSPSTSANSVNAFLRQLDEMDEQLGFSIESTAAAPTSSSSLLPNTNNQPSARISSPTARSSGPRNYSSSSAAAAVVVDGASTSVSAFDILDALDDAASDLSSLGPSQVSSSADATSAPARGASSSEPTQSQTAMNAVNHLINHGGSASTSNALLSLPPSSSSSSSSSSGPLASYASIRTKVVSMSLELEEKTRVISVLRSQIAQARTVMKARESEAISRSEQLVIEARKDLEGRLSQNLSFTERLLSDKARLGSEVEALTRALDTERRRSAEIASEFNDRLHREVLLAQESEREKEKSRRAAWTEATTKELRARTLKSLEPDVQRLLDKHRIEIEKIQQASADEIERAAKRFAAERDAAIEVAKKDAEASGGVQAVESRQAWRAREAALRDEADAQFSLLRDQQRKEIDEERRRSAALSRSVAQEHADEIVKLNSEWQARVDDATRRHADMLASAVREKSDAIVVERKQEIAAREAWEVEERHRLRAEFEAREKEARVEAHKLRDEQLRIVASRLDGEALEARRALKTEMEAVLKKERDEASAHRLALREELDRYRARCEELVRARDDAAASTGNETLRLQQLLDEAKERSVEERSQHRLDFSRMNELQARLQSRVDTLSKELEDSRSSNARLDEQARETISKALASAGQSVAEQKQRLDVAQRVHEEEINLIKTRTSVALTRRDELISQLRLQVDEAREEADTAKRLMQHARTEILGENARFLDRSPSRGGVRTSRDYT